MTDFTESANDGRVRGQGTDYPTARSTSNQFDSTSTTMRLGQSFIDPTYTVLRAFLKFDTSAIGAGSTVTQVNLKLVCVTDQSSTDFDVQIVKQDWSAQDPLSDANREAAYDNCLAGTADAAIWRNTSGMSINTQYASGNLDVSWINKVGNTYYSLRSSRDLGNNSPSALEYIDIASQDHATVAYRPVLTVTFTVPGSFIPQIMVF